MSVLSSVTRQLDGTCVGTRGDQIGDGAAGVVGVAMGMTSLNIVVCGGFVAG